MHSIGVILFRNSKEKIFKIFLTDILPNVEIITLSKKSYEDLAEIKRKLYLDFDDAYQYKIAWEHHIEIVTIDRDFEKVKDNVKVIFIQDIS